ncbi:pyridoxal phosphate-dependent transferase [Entophlyctis helioformis]|nr:pyridoxal phosphate-dependent transferase [Entophlyctis helioformis]
MGAKGRTPIQPSTVAMRTRNPIRSIVDNLRVNPNPSKSFVSLALGDPTTFGNFKLEKSCVEAVKNKLDEYSANGYPPSTGTESARKAIAAKYTRPEAPLSSQDVILASGCSDALNLCIGVLCNEGQNILLPAPGFSLYETLASSKGIDCKFYNLLPERTWEIDVAHLESLIDDKTAAILVNNPSNPCGSVYSKKHLIEVLKVAERHSLPVIADEIYADMAFKGHEFHPMATLTTTVPILSTGGLAKRYLVPGWRVGWLFIHDRDGAFDEVRKGLVNLSQLTLGANSLIQGAIPEILAAPQSFYDETMAQLETNAELSRKLLTGIPGINTIFPQGAMYLMLELKLAEFVGIKDDLDFVEKLVTEESVLCLPGQCFRCPGPFVRIVFTPPADQLNIAYERIRSSVHATTAGLPRLPSPSE